MYSQVTLGMSVGLGPALDKKRLPLLGSMTSLAVNGSINHGFVITESAIDEKCFINAEKR